MSDIGDIEIDVNAYLCLFYAKQFETLGGSKSLRFKAEKINF
jgi:hypothetical protein